MIDRAKIVRRNAGTIVLVASISLQREGLWAARGVAKRATSPGNRNHSSGPRRARI